MKMYKACIKYSTWKQKHHQPISSLAHPKQSPLLSLALLELLMQQADSLKNTDESTVAESREVYVGGAGGEGSEDNTSLT